MASSFTLQINARDGNIYAQWARWMLGVEEGPWGPGTAMRAADALYQQHSQPIRRVARALWDATRPHLAGWQAGSREVYRGLRHSRDDLDGKLLPFDPSYDVPAVSYSEDIRVACYFADPGKKGMPGVTPSGQNRLPPHGYILTLRADGRDILFHWRWLFATGGLFGIADPVRQTPDALAQQEVTVRNSMSLIQRCTAWRKVCDPYIAHRYGPGGWEEGDPDPWGEGWVG